MYEHYWHRPAELDPDKFAAAVEDCRKLCETLKVPLAEAVFTVESLRFNGVPPLDCERFDVDRVFPLTLRHHVTEAGLYTDSCKTRGQMYDVCVTAALVIFKHHFGDSFVIHSDGDDDDWRIPREACQEILGYGDDFRLDVDEV